MWYRKFMRKMLAVVFLASFAPGAWATEVVEDQAYSHYLRAQLLERSGNLGAAIAEFQKSLALDPGSTHLQRELAALYLQSGDADAALSQVEGILKTDPDNVSALQVKAAALVAKGRLAEGLVVQEKIVSLQPDLKEAWLSLGLLYAQEGREDLAIGAYEKLLALQPDSPEVHYNLGLLHERRKNMDQAVAAYRKAVDLDPEYFLGWYALARALENQKDYDGAIDAYEHCAELDYANAGLHGQLGLLYHIQKRPLDAKTEFRRALRYAPGDALALYTLGLIAEEEKNWPEAVLHLGYLYNQAEDLKGAIGALRRASLASPNMPDVWYYLGIAQAEHGDLKAAEASFRRCASLNPKASEPRFQLGVILDRQGRWDESAPEFFRVMELNPKNGAAYNYVGYSYADRGVKLDEALKLVSRAVELDPDSGAYLDSLGWVLFRMGKVEDARKMLATAAAKQTDPVIFDHLGDASEATGRMDDAVAAWSRALRLDPKMKPVRKKLEAAAARHPATLAGLLRRMSAAQVVWRDLTGFVSGEVVWDKKFYGLWGGFTYRRGEYGGPVKPQLRVDLLGPFAIPQGILLVKDRPQLFGYADGAVREVAADLPADVWEWMPWPQPWWGERLKLVSTGRTYRLEGTAPDGRPVRILIDGEKLVVTRKEYLDAGGAVSLRVDYRDYGAADVGKPARQGRHDDGEQAWLPHEVEARGQAFRGLMHLRALRTDPAVDEAVFDVRVQK